MSIYGMIALEVAKGALSGIGSKILNEILGTKQNAVKLQAESIAEISHVFKKVLDSALLDQASAKLESIINNLEYYHNAPTTSLFRLEDAATDCVDLIATLASLKDAGVPSYLVAAGIQITILQDLHTAKGDPGELLNILVHIKRSMAQCGDPIAEKKEIFNRYMAWTAQPVNVAPSRLFPGGGPLWFWIFDGKPHQVATKKEAEEKTKKAAQEWYQTEVAPIAEPYDKVAAEWLLIRQKTIEQANAAGIDVPKGLQ